MSLGSSSKMYRSVESFTRPKCHSGHMVTSTAERIHLNLGMDKNDTIV